MTTHLDVLDQPACDKPCSPPPEPFAFDEMVGPDRFDEIDCDPCKATPFYAAAERIAMREAQHVTGLFEKLLEGRERIDGPLGDGSVLREGMTPGERVRALSAVMPDERKVEWLHRINDMVNDTCPSCGGSIKEDDHDEDCRGPDPEKWELTAEEVDAELRVSGIDPEPMVARFRETVEKALAKRKAKETEG